MVASVCHPILSACVRRSLLEGNDRHEDPVVIDVIVKLITDGYLMKPDRLYQINTFRGAVSMPKTETFPNAY